MSQKVTIIGCGSTGMATAAYLSKLGNSVTLCDTVEQAADFADITAQGGIFLAGALKDDAPVAIDCLTNDFGAAIKSSPLVLICCSAGRHKEVIELVAPELEEGQAVLFVPGNMGSFLLQKALQKLNKKNIITAEMSGSLWACRRRAPGKVLVALPPAPKKIAAYPTKETPAAVEAFSVLFPVEACENVMEATLNSPNVVSHVGGSILNAVQIEKRGDDFAMFQEGLSEVFIKCMRELGKERLAVLEGVGLTFFGKDDEPLFRMLMGEPPAQFADFKALEGPSSLSHRYVSEDAGCGVALLVSLAKAYGVSVPLSENFLNIAGFVNDTDYMAEGYTLENLGLSGLTLEGLKQAL
ncbi:MAG: NAD/NADP octopine/nopaline dehydrogenase family protein [Firmicutes bacterium]|nr:NAD/NADP octopine/nopaline dehydrogenase family protein [Bacillota bacterium]